MRTIGCSIIVVLTDLYTAFHYGCFKVKILNTAHVYGAAFDNFMYDSKNNSRSAQQGTSLDVIVRISYLNPTNQSSFLYVSGHIAASSSEPVANNQFLQKNCVHKMPMDLNSKSKL